MPSGFQVTLNGHELVTVSTEGLNLVDIRVSGIRSMPEFAQLDVTGGCHGEGIEDKYLLWEADRLVQPGGEICVTLVENALTSRPGKTIEETYADEEEQMGPHRSTEQMFELRAQEPLLRDGYVLSVQPRTGETITARTLPEEWTFSYSVRWVWLHPERATVTLSSTSLESIAKREVGRSHARFHIGYNESVLFWAELP